MGSALVRRGGESSEGKTDKDSRRRACADDNTLLSRDKDRIVVTPDHGEIASIGLLVALVCILVVLSYSVLCGSHCSIAA